MITTAEIILTSDTHPKDLEKALHGLLLDIDCAEAEKALGIPLSDLLVRMDQLHHSNDTHHHGESILEHTREVLQDLYTITPETPWRRRLTLPAILHDLGKAFTHEVIDGKHTFRKHGKLSAKIARLLLANLPDTRTAEWAVDLVRYHDLLMQLHEARKTAKGLRYLRKLTSNAIFKREALPDLVQLSRADGYRAKRAPQSETHIKEILQDLEALLKQQEMEARQALERKCPPVARIEALRAFLTAEAPELLHLLPNAQEVNRALGNAKRFETLKRVRAILQGPSSSYPPCDA